MDETMVDALGPGAAPTAPAPTAPAPTADPTSGMQAVPVPQMPAQATSPNAAIAKQLGLSDDTIERYGDVLGIREWSAKDTMRDVALGMLSGDPTYAQKQKGQLRDDVLERRDKTIAQHLAAKREDRAQLQTFFNQYQQLFDPRFPKKHRGMFLKALFKQQGADVPPEVLQLLADDEVANAGLMTALGDLVAAGTGLSEVLPQVATTDGALQMLQGVRQAQEHKRAGQKHVGELATNRQTQVQNDLEIDRMRRDAEWEPKKRALDLLVAGQGLEKGALDIEGKRLDIKGKKLSQRRGLADYRRRQVKDEGTGVTKLDNLVTEVQRRRAGQPPSPAYSPFSDADLERYLKELAVKEYQQRPAGGVGSALPPGADAAMNQAAQGGAPQPLQPGQSTALPGGATVTRIK
jgi:hypothetical protein